MVIGNYIYKANWYGITRIKRGSQIEWKAGLTANWNWSNLNTIMTLTGNRLSLHDSTRKRLRSACLPNWKLTFCVLNDFNSSCWRKFNILFYFQSFQESETVYFAHSRNDKNETLKIMPGDNGLMMFQNTFGELTNWPLVFLSFVEGKNVPPPEIENAVGIK